MTVVLQPRTNRTAGEHTTTITANGTGEIDHHQS
jgi:hypothetical protein